MNWRGRTYPAPPVLGGAPVSPAAMTRVVVAKVRESRAGRASLAMEVRIIVAVDWGIAVLWCCGMRFCA